MSLRPSGFIALPGGPGTGFDHADTYLDSGISRLYVAHTAMNAVDVLDCRSNSYLRSLPGRPRWAVFDPSSDRVFVAIQSPAILLAIDANTLTESHRVEVGAEGPHGLALVGGRLFCAADGGELVVVDNTLARGGPAVARLPLRGSPDVVMHDERRHRLYVAIGSPGLITVFDTERLEELQAVETEDGAHTIGWDPVTAQLYAFAPRRGGALVFEEAE